MTILHSGNVGIGTDSPVAKSHISVSGNFILSSTDYGALFIQSTGSEADDLYGKGITFSDLSGGVLTHAAITTVQTSSDNNRVGLAFIVNDGSSSNNLAEKMRIESGGNVGIGTTTPNAKLDISKPSIAGDTNPIILSDGTLNANGVGSGDPLWYNKMTGIIRPVSGSIVRNSATLYIERPIKAGSGEMEDDSAAIWIENVSKAGFDGGNHYSIYSSETSDSYFAGNIGIGTATPDALLDIDGTLMMSEQPTAVSGVAGKGQVWVKDDSPNILMFTNDVETDYQLALLGLIDHTTDLVNIGTNSHDEIDTHIASTANPHSVSLEQARLVNNQVDGSIDMNTNNVVNLAAPSDGTDAATKDYVDNLKEGLKWKDSALVATTVDTTLSGEQTIDGVLTSSNRVLVKDQSDGTENGIYVTTSGIWSRSTDADLGSELVSAAMNIEQGSTSADVMFVCTNDSITIGVTEIVFVTLGSTISHNNTTGLQGGQASQYYHLTSAEHTNLGTLTDDSMADALHRHSELSASDGSPDPVLFTDATGTVTVSGGSGRFQVIEDDGGTARGIILDQSLSQNAGVIDTPNATTHIDFRIDNSQKMRLDTSGRLGIGTDSPNARLEVTNLRNAEGIRINHQNQASVAGDVFGHIQFYNSDTSGLVEHLSAAIKTIDTDVGSLGKFARLGIFTASGETTDAERISVLNNGMVGIGAIAPIYKLQVQGDSADIALTDAGGGIMGLFGSDSANDGIFQLYNGSHEIKVLIESNGDSYFNGGNVGIGTNSPNTTLHINSNTHGIDSALTISRIDPISIDEVIGKISFGGQESVTNWDSASLRVIGAENWQVGESGSHMLFYTTPVNSITTAEVMRIQSNGYVGIGDTAPVEILHVAEVNATNYSASSVAAGANVLVENKSNNTNGVAGIIFKGLSTTEATGKVGVEIMGSGDADMFFQIEGSGTVFEAMRITSAGNVSGVGTITALGSDYLKAEINATNYSNLTPVILIMHRSDGSATTLKIQTENEGGAWGAGVDAGAVALYPNETAVLTARVGGQVHLDGALSLKERATAFADIAGNGQLWVKTATPNELWFTDDAGTDFNFSSLVNDSMADSLHRHSELSASDGSPNPALSVDAAGNVGIGNAGSAIYKLAVTQTRTNAVNVGIEITQNPVISSTGNWYASGLSINMEQTGTVSYTNTGYHRGVYATVFGGVNNNALLIGLGTSVGHYTGNTGTTTDIWAIGVQPYASAGTITNFYGLFLKNKTSGGTITNYWGVYQEDTAAKNYFAGNVGIGTTPNQLLTVKGELGIQAIGSTNYWVVYTAADNTLRFNYNTAAGLDKIVVESFGHVGIGVDSPAEILHVADANAANYSPSSVSAGANILVENTTNNINGVAGIVFRGVYTTEATGKVGVEIMSNGDADMFFQIEGSGTVFEAMRITSAGDVGIGTAEPDTQLHVGSAGDNIIKIGNDEVSSDALLGFQTGVPNYRGGIGYLNGEQTMRFMTGSTIDLDGTYTHMVIMANGDVGIGTQIPKLKQEIHSLNYAGPSSSGPVANGSLAITGGAGFEDGESITLGLYNSSPYGGWIQVQREEVAGTTRPLVLNPIGGNVGIADNSPDAKLDVNGTIMLTEQSAAVADVAGKGQLWIKNTTPNELWFTDDAGTDHQIS